MTAGYNYRHFNHSDLPTWTEGDALLSERVDALASITRALRNADQGDDDECIRALQDSFGAPQCRRRRRRNVGGGGDDEGNVGGGGVEEDSLA